MILCPKRSQSSPIQPATPPKLSTNQRRGWGKTAVNLRRRRRSLYQSQRPFPVVGRGGVASGRRRDCCPGQVCCESRNVLFQKGFWSFSGKRNRSVSRRLTGYRRGIFLGTGGEIAGCPPAGEGRGKFSRWRARSKRCFYGCEEVSHHPHDECSFVRFFLKILTPECA